MFVPSLDHRQHPNQLPYPGSSWMHPMWHLQTCVEMLSTCMQIPETRTASSGRVAHWEEWEIQTPLATFRRCMAGLWYPRLVRHSPAKLSVSHTEVSLNIQLGRLMSSASIKTNICRLWTYLLWNSSCHRSGQVPTTTWSCSDHPIPTLLLPRIHYDLDMFLESIFSWPSLLPDLLSSLGLHLAFDQLQQWSWMENSSTQSSFQHKVPKTWPQLFDRLKTAHFFVQPQDDVDLAPTWSRRL